MKRYFFIQGKQATYLTKEAHADLDILGIVEVGDQGGRFLPLKIPTSEQMESLTTQLEQEEL